MHRIKNGTKKKTSLAINRKDLLLVLAHGFFGWGDEKFKIGRKELKNAYFYGLKKFLMKEYGSGESFTLKIIAPTVPAVEGVEHRGSILKDKIEEALKKCPDGTRVHILAHSMGGLDARWAIAKEGLADRVGSLTTVATPHRGSSLANFALKHLNTHIPMLKTEAKIIRRRVGSLPPGRPDLHEFFDRMVLNFAAAKRSELEKALGYLTPKGADKFNETIASAEEKARKEVRYFAYGAKRQPGQTPLLEYTGDWMNQNGTPNEKKCLEAGGRTCNDGAVSVSSAYYPWDHKGESYVDTLLFDHLMLINWRIRDLRKTDEMKQELKGFYRKIMHDILISEGIAKPKKGNITEVSKENSWRTRLLELMSDVDSSR